MILVWPSRRRVPADDLVLAAGVAVLSVGGTILFVRGRASDPLGAALLVAAAVPLAARRVQPTAALGLTLLAAFAYSLLDFPGGFFTLAIGVALYSVVDAGHRWRAVGAAAIAVGGLLAIGAGLGRGHVTDTASASWFAGWLVLSLVLGEVTHGRRAYLEQLEQRAVEAERSREEEALRRASEERLRIARELHDVLAHRISSISVQAGVGLHLVERRPEQAREALAAINEASKQALQELRSTLDVLRQVDEPAPRSPAVGLARLGDVVATASAAGLDVRLDVEGDRPSLPASVDLAAYRIVQESLTNVVRHARAGHARVDLTFGRDDLVVQVEDDGLGVPPDWHGGGHGLLGMRERAAALGGELEAGPLPGGGFRVRARLPTGAAG